MDTRREKMHELQRMADRVSVLIFNTADLPAIDIEIEKNKVREQCLELYPDRDWLYDMIYESRFDRLWNNFGRNVPRSRNRFLRLGRIELICLANQASSRLGASYMRFSITLVHGPPLAACKSEGGENEE